MKGPNGGRFPDSGYGVQGFDLVILPGDLKPGDGKQFCHAGVGCVKKCAARHEPGYEDQVGTYPCHAGAHWPNVP